MSDYAITEQGVRHVPASNPNGPGTPNTQGALGGENLSTGFPDRPSVNTSDRPAPVSNLGLATSGVTHEPAGPNPAVTDVSAGRIRDIPMPAGPSGGPTIARPSAPGGQDGD